MKCPDDVLLHNKEHQWLYKYQKESAMADKFEVKPKFAVHQKYGGEIQVFNDEASAIKYADSLNKAMEVGIEEGIKRAKGLTPQP